MKENRFRVVGYHDNTYLYLLLVWCLLAYIFSGIYKNIFFSPIDLTIIWIPVILILSVVLIRDWRALLTAPSVAIGVLIAYVVVRWAFQPTPIGTLRIGKLLVLGLPALLAGLAISQSPNAQLALMKSWSSLGLAGAALVVISSVPHPDTFSSIGSGGYQLTGFFLSGAAVCAATLRANNALAVIGLGALVTGHVTAALFGSAAVAMVWIIRIDWKSALRSSATLTLAVASYWILLGPPLGIQRVGYKTAATQIVLEQGQVPSEIVPAEGAQMDGAQMDGAQMDGAQMDGAQTNGELNSGPSVNESDQVDISSADRIFLWKRGFAAWRQCPLIGCGVGAVDYGANIYAHNIFVEFLADTGFIGVALLVIALVLVFLSAATAPMALGLVVFVTLGALVSGEFGGRMFMMAMGLAAGQSILVGKAS